MAWINVTTAPIFLRPPSQRLHDLVGALRIGHRPAGDRRRLRDLAADLADRCRQFLSRRGNCARADAGFLGRCRDRRRPPLVRVAVEDIDRAVVSSSVAPDASNPTMAPALTSKSRTRCSRRAARFSSDDPLGGLFTSQPIVVAIASLNTCTAKAMPPISSLRAAKGNFGVSFAASRLITCESFEIGVSKWRTSNTDEAADNPRTTRMATPANKIPHSPLASILFGHRLRIAQGSIADPQKRGVDAGGGLAPNVHRHLVRGGVERGLRQSVAHRLIRAEVAIPGDADAGPRVFWRVSIIAPVKRFRPKAAHLGHSLRLIHPAPPMWPDGPRSQDPKSTARPAGGLPDNPTPSARYRANFLPRC